MTIIESRIEACWWNKQTAKGTPATTAFRRGRKVGGDMNVAREDANEQYSDGNRFNSASDFVNTIIGNGNPTLQAQAGVVGHLAYLFLGAETATAGPDPFTHVATPNSAGSFWTTFWKKVGGSVGPLRQKFNDCRIVSLRLEGSSAAKVVKITPTFLSLDSGEVFATDPIATEEAGEPLLYTEAVGTFTIDGVVHKGHSSFALVLNDNIQPWYGDDVFPYDVAYGLGNIVVENLTLAVDEQGLARYNQQIYNNPTPTAGTKPVTTIPALGSYEFDLNRTGPPARQIKVELPGAKFSPDIAIAGNPDGGAVEMQLNAEARAVAGQPMVRITTKSGDAAYT